jgi:hypothetical protein
MVLCSNSLQMIHLQSSQLLFLPFSIRYGREGFFLTFAFSYSFLFGSHTRPVFLLRLCLLTELMMQLRLHVHLCTWRVTLIIYAHTYFICRNCIEVCIIYLVNYEHLFKCLVEYMLPLWFFKAHRAAGLNTCQQLLVVHPWSTNTYFFRISVLAGKACNLHQDSTSPLWELTSSI